MKKLSKIVLILAIVMGVLFIQTQVQASNPIVLGGNTVDNNTVASNTVANNVVNNTTTNNVTTNNTTNTNRNTNTNTLPKTGIEDSPAGIIMVIGVISAIYAYKKIRDYNV